MALWCWLGQDPGAQEVKKGEPFVGPTGKRIKRLWDLAFQKLVHPVTKKPTPLPPVPRSEIWITNAALCQPITSSASEAKAAMVCCRPRLARELKRLHPDAKLLIMGRWALFGATGKAKGMGKLQGFHIMIDVNEVADEARAEAEAVKPKPALLKERRDQKQIPKAPPHMPRMRRSDD